MKRATSWIFVGTFECVLECWDRETREYVAIKVVRGIHKYCDAAMVEIDVLNRLAENEKYRSLCVQIQIWFDYRNHICMDVLLYIALCFAGLEVKPGPTVKCVLGHDFILHFPVLHLGNQRKYFVSLTSFLLLASYIIDLDSEDEEKELNIPVIKENGKDDGKEDQRSEEKAVAAASKSSLGLEKKARMSMSLMILMRVSDYLLKKAML
ncbi:hypothetical protein ZEAMMB73_Zm00001d010768 [Zea mays]|uniref:Uncharacterized protein n=1 Tax=Zea mays TaxID=4577 RepID=A0A1D6FTI8_MAIZE|nr:hypothetical protein ZEAMMB73_Zm00001d010768 [Zea mays]